MPKPKRKGAAKPAPSPSPADPISPPGHAASETSIPLHCLDPAPFNPKKPIHGAYRKGLRGSLDYFGVRGRLNVWPRKDAPGRYYILDGNQRLPVLLERAEDRLIAEHFGLAMADSLGTPDPKELQRVRNDPDNMETLADLKRRAAATLIPVRIEADLDREDAILFTATFNRNHAVYDEAKVAAIADSTSKLSRNILDRIVRPDRAFVQPVPLASLPPSLRPTLPGHDDTPAPTTPKPYTPTEAEPWGPPPEDSRKSVPTHSQQSLPSTPPAPSLVPLMLSLTPDGYKEITETTLRSSVRLFREATLARALRQLEEALAATGEELPIDSIIQEIALLVINRHVARRVAQNNPQVDSSSVDLIPEPATKPAPSNPSGKRTRRSSK